MQQDSLMKKNVLSSEDFISVSSVYWHIIFVSIYSNLCFVQTNYSLRRGYWLMTYLNAMLLNCVVIISM